MLLEGKDNKLYQGQQIEIPEEVSTIKITLTMNLYMFFFFTIISFLANVLHLEWKDFFLLTLFTVFCNESWYKNMEQKNAAMCNTQRISLEVIGY